MADVTLPPDEQVLSSIQPPVQSNPEPSGKTGVGQNAPNLQQLTGAAEPVDSSLAAADQTQNNPPRESVTNGPEIAAAEAVLTQPQAPPAVDSSEKVRQPQQDPISQGIAAAADAAQTRNPGPASPSPLQDLKEESAVAQSPDSKSTPPSKEAPPGHKPQRVTNKFVKPSAREAPPPALQPAAAETPPAAFSQQTEIRTSNDSGGAQPARSDDTSLIPQMQGQPDAAKPGNSVLQVDQRHQELQQGQDGSQPGAVPQPLDGSEDSGGGGEGGEAGEGGGEDISSAQVPPGEANAQSLNSITDVGAQQLPDQQVGSPHQRGSDGLDHPPQAPSTSETPKTLHQHPTEPRQQQQQPLQEDQQQQRKQPARLSDVLEPVEAALQSSPLLPSSSSSSPSSKPRQSDPHQKQQSPTAALEKLQKRPIEPHLQKPLEHHHHHQQQQQVVEAPPQPVLVAAVTPRSPREQDREGQEPPQGADQLLGPGPGPGPGAQQDLGIEFPPPLTRGDYVGPQHHPQEEGQQQEPQEEEPEPQQQPGVPGFVWDTQAGEGASYPGEENPGTEERQGVYLQQHQADQDREQGEVFVPLLEEPLEGDQRRQQQQQRRREQQQGVEQRQQQGQQQQQQQQQQEEQQEEEEEEQRVHQSSELYLGLSSSLAAVPSHQPARQGKQAEQALGRSRDSDSGLADLDLVAQDPGPNQDQDPERRRSEAPYVRDEQGYGGEQEYDGQELVYGDDEYQYQSGLVEASNLVAGIGGESVGEYAAVPDDSRTDGRMADSAADMDDRYDYAHEAAGVAQARTPRRESVQGLLYDKQQGPASRGRAGSTHCNGGGSYSRGSSLANGGGVGSHRNTAAASGGNGDVSPAPQPHPQPQPMMMMMQEAESEALLLAERERFAQQLQMEARAREELEDMILRIEKHFKAEQAARKKAEELLQAAISAELEAKNRLDDLLKRRREEQRVLEEERNGIKRERNALEGMRQDFEAELQAARSEVAKAQDALAASEDRIRAAEAVDRARLESEYQAKISSLQEEIGRLRDELGYRAQLMATEMTRWQQQANLTAAAVMEAKNEVLERKRELDSTKEKMDRLLEKLYIGRERGMELSGAIAAAQSFAHHAGVGGHPLGGPMGPMGHMGGGGGGLASVAGLMPPAMLMAHMNGAGGAIGGGGGGGPRFPQPMLPAVHSPPGPGGAAAGGSGGHSNIPKLPPVNPRPPAMLGDLGTPGPPLSGGARHSAPGSQVTGDGGGRGFSGGFIMPMPAMMAAGGMGMAMGPGMGPGYMGIGMPPGMPLGFPGLGLGMPPAGVLSGGSGGSGSGAAGMGSPVGGGSAGASASAAVGGGGGGGSGPGSAGDGSDPYAHVQSRFAQPVDLAKKGRAVNGKAMPKKQLDRFEESKRDEVRLAAMAKRWG